MKKVIKKGKQTHPERESAAVKDEDVKGTEASCLTLADLPLIEKEKVAKLAENVS